MIWASEESSGETVLALEAETPFQFCTIKFLKVKPADRFPFVGSRLIAVSGQSGT